MPGKRGGNSSSRTKVMPRPKRPPVLAVAPARPKPGGTGPLNLAGALGSLGGAVVGGVKQMGSDAVWSVTHPKERLLGQGRAAGTPITGPDGRVYTLSRGEVALNPGKAMVTGLKTRSSKLLESMGEGSTRAKLSGYVDTPMVPLTDAQVKLLMGQGNKLRNVGVDKGRVQWINDIDTTPPRGFEGAQDMFADRAAVLVNRDGRVVIGPYGSHHHMLASRLGIKDFGDNQQWSQAAIWRGNPAEGTTARFDIGGWAGYQDSRAQKVALSRLLAQSGSQAQNPLQWTSALRKARRTRTAK